MFKNVKEQLTYRRLLQLIGLLIALFIGLMWVRGDALPIAGIEDQHEALLYVLGIAAVLFVLALTIVFPRLVSDESIFGAKDKPISEQNRRKNRDAMLDAVEQIWITGFLDNVLNQMAALNLKLDFLEPDKVATGKGVPAYKLTTTAEIHKHFDKLSRRMVILGVPGAGKTVLLLQLCRELIAEAKADQRRPVPVVLALSSWAAAENSQQLFEDWLKQELREKYGLTQKIAADLVESEQLLYLLDGLDEVAEEKRADCLHVIKTFVETERPGLPYALCSRKKEFEELPTRLSIAGEIVIQRLRPDQIQDYLRGPEFTGLRTLLHENAIIRDNFVPVPFMLNTLAVVTGGKDSDQLQREISTFAGDEARLRDYFLEAYVNRRLKDYFLQDHPANPKLYARAKQHYRDHKQTRRWLKWLAEQLVKRKQTDFYIESLQPNCLDSTAHIKSYQRRVRLALGLALGLASGLALGLASGLALGLAFGLAGGLAGGLAVEREDIRIADQVTWKFSWKWLARGLATGLVFVLAFELKYGLLVGLAVGLMFGFSTRETMAFRPRANIGIQRSFRNFLGIWLALGLALGLVFVLAYGLWVWLALGLLVGLVVGLDNGGLTVIQHVIVQSMLAHNGHIPCWRYDRFLDYAAELVILRKVGGGYRFVHDYLRQYLASAAFVPDAYHVANDESGESR